MVCEYFVPVCSLLFNPLNRVFYRAKVFILVESQFPLLSLLDQAFGVVCKTSFSSSTSLY